jgi:DNA-binding transcriptional LysR family regulator
MESSIPMVGKHALDLRAMKIFLVVARVRSMSDAAKELGMSQSAVSQTIRNIEASLAVELFVRNHRPLSLTQEGSILREKAEPIVREAELIPAILMEAGSAQLPAIRIGLVDSFAGTAGPAFIKNMIDAATQLAVWTGLSPSQGQALLSRQVDVIITSDMIEDVDGLDRQILWQEPFVLIMPKDAEIPKGGPDLRQLAAELPLIRFSARSQLGSQIDRHLRRIGVVAHRRLEIDISDTVTAMVAAGIGWAITTPLCLLQGRDHRDQVHVVPLPGPRVTRRLAAINRAGEYRELSARIVHTARKALQTECLAEINRRWPWLESQITNH